MGLVEALPTQLYVVLALLSFLATLFFTLTLRPVVLGAHVFVFTVLLHGAATIVSRPAWLHVGFTGSSEISVGESSCGQDHP
jgi:hypothetical protein